MSKLYVCSAEPGCNQTFTKFVDFKRHEAAHSANGHICTWPGCDFATKIKSSYEIHLAKHTGEKRYICPNDDCDYKTHDPALFTRHRQKQHAYVPQARGRGAPSAKGSGGTKSSSQPSAESQPPLPPGIVYPYQLQSQPMQPQPTQFYPVQHQHQPTPYQPPPPIHNPSLGVFYGSTDTADDYTMYTGPARASSGWTEGCICPELMQRRPSEMLGYEYRYY
ncbi:hypothetical protein BDR07DRAFT_392988 [Suillus spraguei]|nr:hypothetical protein BDR07DRAFT_392988 [Suillus spraguei]